MNGIWKMILAGYRLVVCLFKECRIRESWVIC
jgi:hypothetical protein